MKKQLLCLLTWSAAGLILIMTNSLNAQSFKRQVLGSVGTNHVPIGGGPNLLSATIGQPPNAGSIGQTNGFCLRQGFQQPVGNSACGLSIDFVVTPTVVPNCGTTYVFEYTGSSVPGLEVSWDFGSNATPKSYSGMMSTPVAFAQAGVESVILTISTGTCMSNVSTTIQVDEAPISTTATITDSKCFGDLGMIQLKTTGLNTPFSYKWADGSTASTRPDLQKGTYGYTVSDSKGCVEIDEAEVKGADAPLISTSKVYSESCDSTKDGEIALEISGGYGPFSFKWSDDSPDQNRTGLSRGTYAVTITDALGCTISSGIKVPNLCHPEDKFLPDIITPNGDGMNDEWLIPDLERFPEFEMLIYNRWGSLVFKESGTYVPWTGVASNGKELPAAAYFYLIRLNNPEKTVWNGAITIVR